MDTNFSAKIDKPGHVPDELVYEFDYNTDPEYCRDPHARTEDLAHAAPPIFWTPYNGGHWIFQSHAAVSEALADFRTFSSEHFSPEAFAAMMAELPEEDRIPAPIPICIDPPLHAKLRQPLFSTFSPKSVAAMEADIRRLAERLVDAISERGRCEFQHAVADLYPVEIFLDMFGLPVEKEREYRELAKRHLSVITPDLAENMLMMKSIADVLRDTVIERRDAPRDDIISMLWSLRLDDEPMNLETMLSYCVILFIAGLDTVVNALGFGVRHLAMDLDLQRQLRENPQLIPNAVEELLRRYAFVAPIRMLKADAEFHGIRLAQGERVMMFIPGASIDASVYPDPTRVDLQRDKSNHMAFGLGPHHCLGAHLARLELKVMYETLLARLPEFRLDEAQPPVFHGSIIAGPKTINLVWAAGKTIDACSPRDPEIASEDLRDASPQRANSAQGTGEGFTQDDKNIDDSAGSTSLSTGVEGTWKVTIHGPTGPQETSLELRTVDGVLRGTQSAMGQVEDAASLAFDGATGAISWINKIRKPLPITLKFHGVVKGDSISGKVNAAIMGSFPFTAERE